MFVGGVVKTLGDRVSHGVVPSCQMPGLVMVRSGLVARIAKTPSGVALALAPLTSQPKPCFAYPIAKAKVILQPHNAQEYYARPCLCFNAIAQRPLTPTLVCEFCSKRALLCDEAHLWSKSGLCRSGRALKGLKLGQGVAQLLFGFTNA